MKLFIIIVAIISLTAQKKITFVYTNDIHGHIGEEAAEYINPEFPPLLGGGASAYTLIKELRANPKQYGEVFLVDGGDMFQGTAVGIHSQGEAIIEYMNAVGYTASVAGNHDFDLGKDNLEKLIKVSNFPILACNIIDKRTNQLWSPIKAYHIVESNGLRIAFVGVATEATENMSFAENIKDLDFVAEKPALEQTIAEIKNNNLADIIIVLAHLGLPFNPKEDFNKILENDKKGIKKESYLNGMEIIHYVEGIDLFFGGHIHVGYRGHWEDPYTHTRAFQNYAHGGNIGVITVLVDDSTKSIIGFESPKRNNENLIMVQSEEFKRDDSLAIIIDEKIKISEKGYDEVLGETKSDLTRSNGSAPMMNLVTDAMRHAAKADISFTNFGGIRANLKRGELSKRDVLKVLPFGNLLIQFSATGSFIKELLEQSVSGSRQGIAISGMQVEYHPENEEGNRIKILRIGTDEFTATATYSCVTSDYLMEGNSGLKKLKEISPQNQISIGKIMSEALEEYIRSESPLNIKSDNRWLRK
jgi:2',3'-cyclic-nucleotide 2'-phosphodiesterase (5'-nucleotidase family)